MGAADRQRHKQGYADPQPAECHELARARDSRAAVPGLQPQGLTDDDHQQASDEKHRAKDRKAHGKTHASRSR
jgi:hypothetical protein